MKRLCEFCPHPSRPAVTSIAIISQGRHRQKRHRAFVCAEHLKQLSKKEQQS